MSDSNATIGVIFASLVICIIIGSPMFFYGCNSSLGRYRPNNLIQGNATTCSIAIELFSIIDDVCDYPSFTQKILVIAGLLFLFMGTSIIVDMTLLCLSWSFNCLFKRSG